jgi:long-chain acyl-CoA synthetase
MKAQTSRPWLNNYPHGVQTDIDPSQFNSLPEMIVDTCSRFSSRPAFSNMGKSLSFSEVDQLSTQFAAYLQSDLKLQKGDRIIIQMPNLLQYPVVLFGAIRAGLVIVNTNPLYTAHEMERNFIDSGAVAIVILENFADKLEQILQKTFIKHIILTEVGDLLPTPQRVLTNFVIRHIKKMVPPNSLHPKAVRFRDALARGAKATFMPPNLQPQDLVFLQYTGGTTGVSKAAMLTHKNVIANLFQMLEWMKPKLVAGQENVVTALPLYHIFCLTVNCFGLFHFGSHSILITNPRDIPGFIKTLSRCKPTVMTVVSTLAAGLMNHPKFSGLNLSALKITVAGGMALKKSVAEEWQKRTKTPIIEGYGLTEASPVISCNPLDGKDQVGTIGMPLPSTEIQIQDESGKPLPQGEIGELCARGPQVMAGYWNKSDETKKVLDSQGWLHTGDIAVLEKDGFLRIKDRKKDMILVSGFNVYPNEVEEVVMLHPKVMDAAAIGIPDEHSGEVVKLFVVKRDPSLTEDELKEYCREYLAGYKRPKEIEFRSDLPKSNVGKVIRRELR